MTTYGMMNPNFLGQFQTTGNSLLGSPALFDQLRPRGVEYPNVPVYGQYGQQALDMAARPPSAPRSGSPMNPLPPLPPAPPGIGGSGGGGGGTDWLSTLMMGGRLADMTGVNIKDVIGRLTGSGATITPALAESAHAGAMSGVAETAAANEAALLGQSAPTLATGGALGGGLAASAEAGALSGIGATQAATEAALLGQAAPTLATGGAAAGGGSAAAGGGAAAAGTSAAGLAAGLGVAAIPLAIMALGGFANDRNSREALALQQSGLQQTQLQGGTRVLIRPDGGYVPFNDNLMKDIRERWGVVSTDDFWKWMNALPTVEGNVRRVHGRELPRGGYAARSDD